MNPATFPLRILIAGGGTGGHLFPGIAVAQEFMRRNPHNETLFVHTGKPFEKKALAAAGFRQTAVTAEGIKGRSVTAKLLSVTKVPKGMWESLQIIRRFKPDILLGLGSYASGVVVLAGWFSGKTVVLCEQNRLPGITNRILFPLADRLYVSFPGTCVRKKSPKVLLTGNPVRHSLLAATGKTEKESGDPFTILIIGGSQGAHAINVAVTQALFLLSEKKRIHFMHQTGAADAAWVREAYASAEVSGEVAPFFDDMNCRYGAADLVICRSGATTVAEVTALGKPALFIPFPFAADDHQTLNARELADAGAAEMLTQERLDSHVLAGKIEAFTLHPERLAEMAARAKAFGRPEAAATIVEDMTALVLNLRGKRYGCHGKQKA